MLMMLGRMKHLPAIASLGLVLLLHPWLSGCTSTGGGSASYAAVPVAGSGVKAKRTQQPKGSYSPASPMAFSPAAASLDDHNTEGYASLPEIPFRTARKEPLSTFSIDVDTASYANVRRLLQQGERVPPGAVRVEEMINYFSYNYPLPSAGQPFSVNTATASCPWQENHRLVRIGLRGREIARSQRPPSNLVFLIDVSGSMGEPNKLPLVQSSLRLLLNELQPEDRVALTVYAGAEGLVLPSTRVSERALIGKAIDTLSSGGSTNGGAGINLAYETARQQFLNGGNNRVILATDGDFNVGITDESSLTALIQKQARSGIFLSVLGFGMGNYKDSTLEKLADKGNGNYAYIDTLKEGRKVLVREMGASLFTIARDVKIQVEFNPAKVAAWRLLGYENRVLAHQDFDDDTKDAGDIGAGHRVTALYEVVPAGQPLPVPDPPDLKYTSASLTPAAAGGDLLTVKLRYQPPAGGASKLITQTVSDAGTPFAAADVEFRFATSVAAFGMKLRGSPHAARISKSNILGWAKSALGSDPHGDRAEFLRLVKKM
jgi:Ca-activated chloride channel homolog